MDQNKLEENWRNPNGTLKVGHPDLGAGRPKGSFSIKERVRKRLEEHPEEFAEFVEHFIKKNRELAWRMLEGDPSKDLNLGTNPELPFVINIQKNESPGTDG